MDENEHQLLVVGLPETGKTSFIHAVDDLLQSPPTPEALRSYGLAGDRSYLERDKRSFRAGKKLVHTERSLQEAAPELWFEDPRTGRRGRLFLPDLRGEIFQDQWTDRRWTESFRDDLEAISGALVFVRADTPASNQELLGQMLEWAQKNVKPAPWDLKKASPQVQLVDVLQFIGTKAETVPAEGCGVDFRVEYGRETGQSPAQGSPGVPSQGMAAAGPVPPLQRRDLCQEGLRRECAGGDGGGIEGAE